ncbi:hypothetical protein BUALT_BualtMtG0004800 (mitochondrion) [Buddleja alternifolia]|uniref:Uncharacterized protein n=1 Tax=Buddleja alternifolia TaxID=168488 RepID=A0AAV6W0Y7_9LAMI|nr:hypothetical protein BUALT_BualtMtG0004800 [Buddleja alternifolia]
MAHGSALTSKKKGRKKCCCLTSILIEIALLCQKKDSYTDSVYSKDTLESIPPVHEYVELSMSGSTGKRSFADIIRYWVIHNKNLYLPYLLDELRGLFVSTGLASFSSIGSENLFDAEVAAHREQSIVCRETIAEVGLGPKPLTILGPVIDLQHSGHAASGSMTGRAGKMSEKQPQPSRTRIDWSLMLERKRISDAIESVRGRLEESSSCPAKSDRRIEKNSLLQAVEAFPSSKAMTSRSGGKATPVTVPLTQGIPSLAESGWNKMMKKAAKVWRKIWEENKEISEKRRGRQRSSRNLEEDTTRSWT